MCRMAQLFIINYHISTFGFHSFNIHFVLLQKSFIPLLIFSSFKEFNSWEFTNVYYQLSEYHRKMGYFQKEINLTEYVNVRTSVSGICRRNFSREVIGSKIQMQVIKMLGTQCLWKRDTISWQSMVRYLEKIQKHSSFSFLFFQFILFFDEN